MIKATNTLPKIVIKVAKQIRQPENKRRVEVNIKEGVIVIAS